MTLWQIRTTLITSCNAICSRSNGTSMNVDQAKRLYTMLGSTGVDSVFKSGIDASLCRIKHKNLCANHTHGTPRSRHRRLSTAAVAATAVDPQPPPRHPPPAPPPPPPPSPPPSPPLSRRRRRTGCPRPGVPQQDCINDRHRWRRARRRCFRAKCGT